MIPAVNKYKHLLLVKHTAKAIQHHRHHHKGWYRDRICCIYFLCVC